MATTYETSAAVIILNSALCDAIGRLSCSCCPSRAAIHNFSSTMHCVYKSSQIITLRASYMYDRTIHLSSNTLVNIVLCSEHALVECNIFYPTASLKTIS